MVDSGLIRRRTTEDRRLPGVEVAVEVDHRDLPVRTVDRPKQRKDDGVVAAESDDARVVLAIRRERNKRLASEGVVAERREGRTVEELLMAVLDLLDSELVVVRRDGDITAVDDLEAGQEGVDLERHVVAAVEGQATRARTNTRRPKTRSGTIGCTRIKRRTEESNVELDVPSGSEALYPREFGERCDSGEDGIGGYWDFLALSVAQDRLMIYVANLCSSYETKLGKDT